MCSVGGVDQSTNRELCYLDTGFYGVGFPHWGIEATIESINKLMSHFGSKSMTGVEFQMSYELLIIELGLSNQPFLLDFNKYHNRAAPTLLTEVWSRMHRFGFKLTTNMIKFSPPREKDRWFMSAVEDLGFSEEECRIINLVRIHQQVIFELDVFEEDGQKLDTTYLQKQPTGVKWSNLLFLTAKMQSRHFTL